MIFNEIYGCYYNAVAKIIALAVDNELTEKKINEITSDYAFGESMLEIAPALKNQDWLLIDRDMRTPIKNRPSMPMTTIEKRWLKTILLDPRAALFQPPMDGLEDVEPLFLAEDVVYFDRYLDGDRYEDPEYIANFRLVVQAIREHRHLCIRFRNRKNQECKNYYTPLKLEYSDKEDKFRILCSDYQKVWVINMGRVISAEIVGDTVSGTPELAKSQKETLVFRLYDARNTLERVLMKFSHYKKEVERLQELTYLVRLEYDVEDETDVLIQMLSFGSYVKILEPDRIKKDLCDRIKKQITMLGW